MLAALNPLAAEVVTAGTCLEREAKRIDEQLATLRRIRRDHRDGGNELDIHVRSVWRSPLLAVTPRRRARGRSPCPARPAPPRLAPAGRAATPPPSRRRPR